MKIIVSVLFVLSALFTQLAAAHGDHAATIAPQQAVGVAASLVKDLVARDVGLGFGKLAESWSAISQGDMGIHKAGKGYYVVSVPNKSLKKTLYILMSTTGEAYDANFTGAFEGLE
ncbi:DUF6488 family protein [Teredinibacter waterburyi]|uniref:DUF6488 family protein n=1 Tax=Teredinibacter waterburyi TaxID=1500538 RepID=UPI00165F3F2D|nr:DUF6488 family protein [Teredinibacter waterburyi]